jgi:nucleoid-associated protein YgaU
MTENWGRGVGALAVLAAVWILVYWWWEPSRPRISFDESRITRETEPDPVEAPVPPRTGSLMQPAPTGPGLSPSPKPRATTESAAPKLAVIPPTFRAYTVKKGDTWQSIATKEMGSPDLWRELTRANPLMTDLKPDRAINIPIDPTNIQGRPVGEAPTTPDASPGIEYTVKSGDTLGGIARAYYGSTSYKDLIFQANRDRLDREDQLKIGQKLRLPPKPN